MFIALALASLLMSSAVAETVHGVVVFTRHGDRTTKHYGAQALTNLGATQNFQVGSDYRARYITAGSPHQILNVSEFNYVSSQLYATAPNQDILLNTATTFLQGLYPPLVGLNSEIASQTLNNGSELMSPLNGYQYVTLQGVDANSPDAVWIKGDDGCPAITEASESFEDSVEFSTRIAATRDFYRSFFPVLQSVYDYKSPDNMSYANAFDIFDLINVARIHNATSLARNVTDEQLFQLRTLADSAEFGYNYNLTQPARSIHAETFSGAILSQLNQTVTSKGKRKFALLAGSYDTFLGFFGLANLTAADPNFFGLPEYASTMAFELFSPDTMTSFPEDPNTSLRVRFLFRNSTFGTLTSFPLFGTGAESLSWPDFVTQMQRRAITTADKWCSVCASTANFCAAYEQDDLSASSGSGMSNAVAGVIGAMATLVVLAIVGVLTFVLLRKRQATPVALAPGATPGEKTSIDSGSEGGVNV
ncbi:hypothetical protein DL771_004375 [Monosporascus sp. 5C6A]|nr:hypothetical protein DL771_004375 [Monosporascus sp. 5C6A]